MAKSPKKTPAPTPAKPRAKKPRPSFDVPAAAASTHVGWVYRSDEAQGDALEEASHGSHGSENHEEISHGSHGSHGSESLEHGSEEPLTHEGAARWIVKKHAMFSAGAGLVPVPWLDMAAVAAVQVRMITELAKHYGVAMSKEAGKTAVAALLGSVAPAAAPRICKALFRRLPVVGPVVSALTISTFASSATYAVGKIFIRHFERGGTGDSFDVNAARDEFAAELAS